MKLKKSYLVNFDLITFNRFFSKFFLFLFSLLLFSCKSAPLPVPGETTAKKINIYTEYFNIAESYFKIEDYNNALKYYELAMQNKKNYWAAYYKKAKCYVYLNDWANSLPMYKTLLKRDKENTSLKASIAYIYCMQNEVKNATECYLELLEIEPTNKSYLENFIALLLSDEKNLEDNKNEIEQRLNVLKENYPDSENTTKLQQKYDELFPKENESVPEENSESNTESELEIPKEESTLEM